MGVDYLSMPDYLITRLSDAHDPGKARIRAEFFRKEFEFFSKHIRDKKVLVGGSGFGHDSFELAKYNKLVVGVEIHPVLLEYSRKKLKQLGITNIRFEKGDMTCLRFGSNSFDAAVLNMGTIGNFDNKPAMIKELLRVAEAVYLDFYPPSRENLETRRKMYVEEGWVNARIKGNSLVTDDGMESVGISKREMTGIVESIDAKVKYYPLCSFAAMAEITRRY